jgi:hypothetical protein
MIAAQFPFGLPASGRGEAQHVAAMLPIDRVDGAHQRLAAWCVERVEQAGLRSCRLVEIEQHHAGLGVVMPRLPQGPERRHSCPDQAGGIGARDRQLHGAGGAMLLVVRLKRLVSTKTATQGAIRFCSRNFSRVSLNSSTYCR